MSTYKPREFPSPASSGPPSPRKRRRLLRESEDNEGEMRLEEFLYRTDPFRSNTFHGHDNSEMKTEFLTAEENPTRHLRPEIDAILSQHRIPTESFHHTLKARVTGSYFFLLRVTVSGDGSTFIRLGPIKDSLVKLLHKNSLTNVHVEVLNGDHFSPPHLYPIASTSAVVSAFHTLKHSIVETMSSAVGENWQMICPFNVGGPDIRSTRPGIVIFVQPLLMANWYEIRARIIGQLSLKVSALLVDVEFLPGTLNLLKHDPSISFRDRFNDRDWVAMGDSIGISGDQNAGTLGGFVELRYDDRAHFGFLTNYHVVRPIAHTPFRDEVDRTGISANFPPDDQNATIIESIAQMDRDRTLANIQHHRESLASQKARIEETIELRLLAGEEPREASRQRLQDLDVADASLIQTQNVVKSMPYVLGKVRFASGLLVHDKRFLDWAFVELTTEAQQRYFRPNIVPDIPRKQGPTSNNLLSGGSVTFLPRPNSSITQFGELQTDEYYFKKGRTTDVTGGICNGAKSVCQWKGRRYDIDGAEISMATHITEEYVITGVDGDFLEDGDSGSFVISADRDVAGMLFADVIYEGNSIGVALNMPDVVESMKLRLNHSVSLHLP
ncbi:hypothetical protein N7501_009776 [Penicillium viridicatum]|nr:hypothetical protein N7501_009776 [Penicillium viridicatum]